MPMNTATIPAVIFIGRSGVGKTTLIERLVQEFGRRGYRLASVKHHSHAGFDIDAAGKDSWRFARAGSRQVVIASPDKFATYWKLEHELSLDEVLAHVHGVDLILVEGYRSSNKPSIEILRAASGLELVGSLEQCLALVSDAQVDLGIPRFHLDDIEAVANLIETRFLVGNQESAE